MHTDYYVYVIYRNDGTPCYVGKGRGNRCNHHKTHSHNPWLRNIAKKHAGDIRIEKVAEGLTNDQASVREIELIKSIGRINLGTGPLVNFTDGGDGTLGRVVTADERKRIAAALTGKRRPPEVIAKMSAALKGRKPSPESIEKTAVANRGKKRLPETIAKISASNTGKRRSPETIAKLSAARLGKPTTITDKVLRHRETLRGKKMPWMEAAKARKKAILSDPIHPLYAETREREDLRIARIAEALSRPKTAEEIAAMPQLQKGVPKSAAHREALSKAHKGVKLSESHIRNGAEARRGLKRSEETKARMSAAQISAWERRRTAALSMAQAG